MKTPFLVLLGLVLLESAAVDAQDAPPAATSTVWLPDKAWALEMDGTGFNIRGNEIESDGRRYFLAENPQTHILVSVFLEAAKAPVQGDECKHSLEEKAKSSATLSLSPLREIAYATSGDLQTLTFMLRQIDGMPKNQKNLFACLVKDDVFVDIHISKLYFRAVDQPLFDSLLQSIRFVPREAADTTIPAGNSMQLFQQGGRFFLAHQYREAIAPYRQALEIEKSTPTLDKNLWRVLVENLSIAYGLAGETTHARDTLNYGISKDPDYPLFYYTLACTAAERGSVSEAEKNLTLAFEHRNNMIAGESLPDARVDDSFQKLLLQKDFKQFLDSLYRPQ